MTWQPIETAPKDGTPILTFAPVTGADYILIGAWIPEDEPGETEDGGTWRDDGETPTHWMPLPEPPEAA